MSQYLKKFEPKKRGNPHNGNRRPKTKVYNHSNHFQSEDDSDSSSNDEYEEILIDNSIKVEQEQEQEQEQKPPSSKIKTEKVPLVSKAQKQYHKQAPNQPIIIKKTIKKYYKPKQPKPDKEEDKKESKKQELEQTSEKPTVETVQLHNQPLPLQQGYLTFNPISSNTLLNRLKNF